MLVTVIVSTIVLALIVLGAKSIFSGESKSTDGTTSTSSGNSTGSSNPTPTDFKK